MTDPLHPHINADGKAYNGNHRAVTLAGFIAVGVVLAALCSVIVEAGRAAGAILSMFIG